MALTAVLGGLMIIGSGGCSDFRERAAEVTAVNTTRILELQDHIEVLEQQLEALLDQAEES